MLAWTGLGGAFGVLWTLQELHLTVYESQLSDQADACQISIGRLRIALEQCYNARDLCRCCPPSAFHTCSHVEVGGLSVMAEYGGRLETYHRDPYGRDLAKRSTR
jgi:hypothetical protein